MSDSSPTTVPPGAFVEELLGAGARGVSGTGSNAGVDSNVVSSVLSTEADYLGAWQRHAAQYREPVALAIAGGCRADRFAWVFVAGYQAAIRRTFTLDRLSGWCAFAVSEGGEGLPGVRLRGAAEDGELNGYKTWVAGAASVENLIVKAGRGAAAEYYLLPRQTPGLQISPGARREFLAELSQGSASLQRVRVGADQRLDRTHAGAFGLAETLLIYTAFCAFVRAHSTDESISTRCLRLLEQSVTLLSTAQPKQTLLKPFDDDIQQLLSDIEQMEMPRRGNWQKDRRLVSMYSAALQRQPNSN